MASKTTAELRAEAERLIAAVDQHETVLPADRAALVDALTADLGAADDQAVIAEHPIVKLETQVGVLSEAIIALTDTAKTVAPALQVVKDQM